MEQLKEYVRIIMTAKTENRKKYQGVYYENHHIFPKALSPELIKDENNLVLLTAREHFVCHRLLAEILGGRMWSAYSMLAHDKRTDRNITEEEYEFLKINYANFRKGHKLWPNGRVFSAETREKMKVKATRPKPWLERKVICLETKELYSVKEANTKFGIKVHALLRQESQHYYHKGLDRNHHWAYYDDTKTEDYWNKLLEKILNTPRKCPFHRAEYKCLETGEIFVGYEEIKSKFNKESIASLQRHVRGVKDTFCGLHFKRIKKQY
jgi:hypothetical protein